MEFNLGSRLRKAWNAFFSRDPTMEYSPYGGYSYRPDRVRLTRGNERTIANSVYNRISLDVASISIQHVRLDENGRYKETIEDGLNSCLTLSANIDQTSRAFIQDTVLSMLDEGVVAIVPIDASANFYKTSSFDVYSMRTAKIIEWYPDRVRVRVYNDRTGEKEDLTYPKSSVCIIENPLYSVINEPNSTAYRLMRKLSLLDAADEQANSGKLDLIIQLPYTVKSPLKQEQAEKRRHQIEDQLMGSKYGIAYIDSTEHITQLNRSLENNLLKQIEYLTNQFYAQLGITTAVMDGTANEETMLNYQSRTVEPIISAIADELKRKFLTQTARSQGQSIMFFKDPFKLVPVSQIAEIADKMTRNEIMTSNEIRQIIGMKPSGDPEADKLRNKNLSEPKENQQPLNPEEEIPGEEADGEETKKEE